MKEIWKDVIDYEDHYKVSNLGNVKSVKFNKEIFICKRINKSNYYYVFLYKNNKSKNCLVHQLVAKAFLNYVPQPYKIAVNHINIDRLDNRLENLEIVTQRENCNKKHLNNISKYVGVCKNKKSNSFYASIVINRNRVYLGYSLDDFEASKLYQIALENIDLYDGDSKKFRNLVKTINKTKIKKL